MVQDISVQTEKINTTSTISMQPYVGDVCFTEIRKKYQIQVCFRNYTGPPFVPISGDEKRTDLVIKHGDLIIEQIGLLDLGDMDFDVERVSCSMAVTALQ